VRVWAFWHIWVACLIFCLVVCFSQFLYQIGDTLFFDLLGFVIFTFTFIQAPTSHSGCVLSSVYFYVMFYEKAMLRRIQDTRHFFLFTSHSIMLWRTGSSHPRLMVRSASFGFWVWEGTGVLPGVWGDLPNYRDVARESCLGWDQGQELEPACGLRNRTVVFFSNISCFSKRKE